MNVITIVPNKTLTMRDLKPGALFRLPAGVNIAFMRAAIPLRRVGPESMPCVCLNDGAIYYFPMDEIVVPLTTVTITGE